MSQDDPSSSPLDAGGEPDSVLPGGQTSSKKGQVEAWDLDGCLDLIGDSHCSKPWIILTGNPKAKKRVKELGISGFEDIVIIPHNPKKPEAHAIEKAEYIRDHGITTLYDNDVTNLAYAAKVGCVGFLVLPADDQRKMATITEFADLHDEPEGALPSTDGEVDDDTGADGAQSDQDYYPSDEQINSKPYGGEGAAPSTIAWLDPLDPIKR